jgi:hypothetical protein
MPSRSGGADQAHGTLFLDAPAKPQTLRANPAAIFLAAMNS